MKISNFILISTVALIALFSFDKANASVVNETTDFDNSMAQIHTTCKTGHMCDIYYVKKSGAAEKKIISFPFAPSSINFDNGTFVIRFPCGTMCSATYFYKNSRGLSGPYKMVAAYNIKRNILISLAKKEPYIYRIFVKNASNFVKKVPINTKYPNKPSFASVVDVEKIINILLLNTLMVMVRMLKFVSI